MKQKRVEEEAGPDSEQVNKRSRVNDLESESSHSRSFLAAGKHERLSLSFIKNSENERLHTRRNSK